MNDELQYGVWKLNAIFQEKKPQREQFKESDKGKKIEWAKEQTLAAADQGLPTCVLLADALKGYFNDVAMALFESGLAVKMEFNENQKLIGLRVSWELR